MLRGLSLEGKRGVPMKTGSEGIDNSKISLPALFY